MAEITLEKALTLQEFYIKIWQGNGYYPCKKYLKEGDKWRCHDSKRNENGLFWKPRGLVDDSIIEQLAKSNSWIFFDKETMRTDIYKED